MKCINCSSTEDLVRHHIVPLENGGNDIDTNICILCSSCKTKADTPPHKKVGRPRIILDTNIENVLHMYFQCKIGTAEARQLIGLPPRNNSTWQRLQKEYKSKHNIIDSRNNVDNIRNNPRINSQDERPLGYIKLIYGYTYRFWNTGLVEKRKYIK